MKTNLDLKQTEKASFKLAAYADGTTDIGLGLMMILLGFYPLTRQALGVGLNIAFFLVAMAVIIGLQTLLKTRLGPSRIGVVKFGKNIWNRKIAVILVLAVLIVLTGLTWYASVQGVSLPNPGWVGGLGIDLVFAAVILVVFWALAFTLGLDHFYAYGALLAVAFLDLIPASLIGLDLQLSLALTGMLITFVGALILVSFLRKYPAAHSEEEV